MSAPGPIVLLLVATKRHSLSAVRLAFTVVVVCASIANGQDKPSAPVNPAPSYTTLPKPSGNTSHAKLPDPSKEALAIDPYSTLVRMENDGTGTRETTARIRIQANAGVKAMAVLPFTHSACFEPTERHLMPKYPGVLAEDDHVL